MYFVLAIFTIISASVSLGYSIQDVHLAII